MPPPLLIFLKLGGREITFYLPLTHVKTLIIGKGLYSNKFFFNNKLNPPTTLKNNKNKDIKTLLYFYKIFLFYILNLIIYKTKNTNKNINKRVNKKINKNKTPKQNKKNLG